jgi:hypothetical protein
MYRLCVTAAIIVAVTNTVTISVGPVAGIAVATADTLPDVVVFVFDVVLLVFCTVAVAVVVFVEFEEFDELAFVVPLVVDVAADEVAWPFTGVVVIGFSTTVIVGLLEPSKF